jgi:hypothetical protein
MLANVSVLKIAVLAAAEVINLRAYTYYIRDGAARRGATRRDAARRDGEEET